jgi:hypothetical protein
MCKLVNVKYKDIDFLHPSWYLQYQWSLQTERKFRKWLVEYMLRHKQARIELMNVHFTARQFIEKFADEWLFMYGWKTIIEECN